MEDERNETRHEYDRVGDDNPDHWTGQAARSASQFRRLSVRRAEPVANDEHLL